MVRATSSVGGGVIKTQRVQSRRGHQSTAIYTCVQISKYKFASTLLEFTIIIYVGKSIQRRQSCAWKLLKTPYAYEEEDRQKEAI